MGTVVEEVLSANRTYAETFGAKAKLAMRPARQFAILTCMDARLDPAKFAGLSEGDAHVIRNAGGRATDDAIRALVISHKLLGTKEWFVIHHTDCAVAAFPDDVMAQLGSGGGTDAGKGPGSSAGNSIEWLPTKDQTQSIVEDVVRIRTHPPVPPSIPIYGYLYDVRSGRLMEIPEATAAGKGR